MTESKWCIADDCGRWRYSVYWHMLVWVTATTSRLCHCSVSLYRRRGMASTHALIGQIVCFQHVLCVSSHCSAINCLPKSFSLLLRRPSHQSLYKMCQMLICLKQEQNQQRAQKARDVTFHRVWICSCRRVVYGDIRLIFCMSHKSVWKPDKLYKCASLILIILLCLNRNKWAGNTWAWTSSNAITVATLVLSIEGCPFSCWNDVVYKLGGLITAVLWVVNTHWVYCTLAAG